jgi:hypothetical protein
LATKRCTDTQVDAQGNPYTASVYGTQALDTSDLSGFIDFDSVTSAEVQGWVESAMGAEQVQTNIAGHYHTYIGNDAISILI